MRAVDGKQRIYLEWPLHYKNLENCSTGQIWRLIQLPAEEMVTESSLPDSSFFIIALLPRAVASDAILFALCTR